MGLFFRNYDTPGKGVSKNEPKKRGFFRFFELYFRNFWKLISAQFWYILLCLPVLTCGLGEVGLAYISRMAAVDKHTFVTSDFFDAIKKNWKKALSLGIINLLITLVFAANLYIIIYSTIFASQTARAVMLVVTLFLFVLFSFARFYQNMLMITFDFKLGTIIKNSFLFATLGIKHNLIIGGTLLLCYFAAYWALSINITIALPIVIILGVFLFPSFRSFLIQFNVFPEIKKYIIDPYYNEHPDDDIEKRRELGLIEDEDEDDAVFEDTHDSNET